MLAPEIFQLTARLRRNMSRNPDVLAACDELERLVAARIEIQRPPAEFQSHRPRSKSQSPKRDRAAYMRDYRRRKA